MLKAVHAFIISKDQLHDVLRRGRRLHRVGRDLDLSVWRDGAELHIEVELHMMAEDRDQLAPSTERIGLSHPPGWSLTASMRRCPRCGWALSDREPDGLCPACTPGNAL